MHKENKISSFSLALIIMILLIIIVSLATRSDGAEELYEPPTTIAGMLEELNTDPVIHGKLGFAFDCEYPDKQYPVLVFYTGKSYADIDMDWMRYGRLTLRIAANWIAITGGGIVVGLDIEYETAFFTDIQGGFHMIETPSGKKRELEEPPQIF